MTLHDHDQHPAVDEAQAELPADEAPMMSRRTVLRRSFLGVTGIGLTSMLSACGWWEDEEDDADDDEGVVDGDDEVIGDDEEGTPDDEGI